MTEPFKASFQSANRQITERRHRGAMGFSLVEILISVSFLMVISAGISTFFFGSHKLEAKIASVNDVEQANNIFINLLEKGFVSRDTSAAINGFAILDEPKGLHFTIHQTEIADSSHKFMMEYESWCRPLPLVNAPFFRKIGTLDASSTPVPTTGSRRGECLRRLGCGAGMMSSIRYRKVDGGAVSSWTMLPNPASLNINALEKMIGTCVMMTKISNSSDLKIQLQLDSMLYSSESCKPTGTLGLCFKVLSKAKTLPIKNIAGIKLLP